MPIVQIFITFAVGTVSTFIVIAIITGAIAFGANENIDMRIRVGGLCVVSILMSYLIGLIIISSLGGYYGVSELLR